MNDTDILKIKEFTDYLRQIADEISKGGHIENKDYYQIVEQISDIKSAIRSVEVAVNDACER
ncbi:MAG: hypothetical protein MJZ34_02540 [Paludibacteraceae bacterium]|nr:hypothetical protein [Paludibacteraceae bacterium]